MITHRDRLWSRSEDYRKRQAAEAEFDRVHGPRLYKTIQLPEEEWYTCPTCSGAGQYLEQGDLHRSEGIVPCIHCHKGLRRTKTIEVKRRVRVKAGRKVVP